MGYISVRKMNKRLDELYREVRKLRSEVAHCKYDTTFYTPTSTHPLQSVVCLILDHLKLELQHTSAKDSLVKKGK